MTFPAENKSHMQDLCYIHVFPFIFDEELISFGLLAHVSLWQKTQLLNEGAVWQLEKKKNIKKIEEQNIACCITHTA